MPVPNDHGLTQSRLNPRLEADVAQSVRASFSGFDAGFMKSGIGRDARDGEQPEQTIKRRRLFPVEIVKYAFERTTRRLRSRHDRTSATSRRARQSSILSPIAVLAPSLSVRMDERLDCGGGLFAELHVDGLRTFTAPVGLRFEGNPRTLVKRWETRALQRRDMQEHILAAIIRLYEAEPS